MSQDAIPVAQAHFRLQTGVWSEVDRSPDFEDAWLPDAERLCRAFGTPPDDALCPPAVFAQPLMSRFVAVVQVAGDVPGILLFRMLVVPRSAYVGYIADPFRLAERFPANWSQRGPLPSLDWPPMPLPRRSVTELQQVLQTGGSPTLLGAVQALIDGGRVFFERPAPALQLVRDLWQLLPTSVHGELWPATFAYSNELRFDILVTPNRLGMNLDRYVSEESSLDYPEGRYELGLQSAIEHGDQAEVDRLLGRRSSKQMLRLALLILFGSILTYVGVNFLLKWLS